MTVRCTEPRGRRDMLLFSSGRNSLFYDHDLEQVEVRLQDSEARKHEVENENIHAFWFCMLGTFIGTNLKPSNTKNTTQSLHF